MSERGEREAELGAAAGVRVIHGDSVDSTQQETDAGNTSIRRSERDKKLSLKAKESQTVHLFARLVTAINKHSDVNDQFLETYFSGPDVDVVSFVNDLNVTVEATTSIYNEIKQINDGEVNPEHESLFVQYLSDIEIIKQHLSCLEANQKKRQEEEALEEEEERLRQEEQVIAEAQRKLEEDMKLYKEKRARRIQGYQSTMANIAMLQTSSASHNSSTSAPAATPADRNVTHSDSNTIRAQQATRNERQPTDTSINTEQPSNAGKDFDWIKQFAESLAGAVNKGKSKKASVEPSVFKGDILQFADWEVDLDAYLDAEDLTGKEALRHLKKFVSEEAKRCIEGHFLTNTSAAYMEARKTLKERYGNKQHVARMFRKKLSEWPHVKARDGQGLRDFGDLLAHICSASESIPGLKSLNESEENEKLAEKLPEAQRLSWARRVADLEEEHEYPTLVQFKDFVMKEAKILLLPLAQGKAKEPTHKRNFQANTETPVHSKTSCYVCEKDNHETGDCRELAKKTYRERLEFVKANRLCFACLKKNHQSRNCWQKSTCKICSKSHPTALHNPEWKQDLKKEQSKFSTVEATHKSANEVAKSSSESAPEAKVHSVNISKASYSMMVPVYISSNDTNERLIYAMLDTQSDACFITEEVAKTINASGRHEMLTIHTMNGEQTRRTSKYEGLKIRGYLTDSSTTLDAYGQETIKCDTQQIPTESSCTKLSHLKDISKELSPLLDIPVGLLIGIDCPEALTPLNSIPGNPGEPFAVQTMFGWTVCGGKTGLGIKTSYKSNAELFKLIEHEFKDAEDKSLSQEDIQFVQTLTDGVYQDQDGSYTMPLPLKRKPNLPNNRIQAEKRLDQLKKKLLANQSYKDEYFSFMNELLKNGHAEMVPMEDLNSQSWYIPNFGVRHPKKQKLRVVFDASATYNGASLNDYLLPGPAHINDLLGILCRFRRQPVALTCDVEKMFYNFKVSKHHREYLRFLWFDQEMTDVKTYQMTVHLFGATSSPGVATSGLRKLAEDGKDISLEASNFLIRDFYVDDGITSVDSVVDAK